MHNGLGMIGVVVFIVMCGSWVVNLNQLLACDFKSDYRCEAVHAVGLIPIASVVTVWVDTEEVLND
jgi:hypothetical protein